MGRLTQGIDVLNASPEDFASAEYRSKNYTKIAITPELKKARADYRRNLKQQQKTLFDGTNE